MKQIYAQTEPGLLYTDVITSFKRKDKIAHVLVFSEKCFLDDNFLKPYENGSIRTN